MLSGELAGRVLSPQQSAFLALVYGHRRISRPQVSRILWRRDADRRTRASIRQLRHQVTRRAGLELVGADQDDLVITVGIDDDLGAWDCYMESGRYVEAARLLSEGFVSRPPDGVPLEFLDWKDRFEHSLRARLDAEARVAWLAAREAEQWESARDAAEAMYMLRKREDRDYRRIIEARAKSGRLLAAEVAYADYVQHVAGSAPDDEVEALMERVRTLAQEQDLSLAAAEVPFVGRVDELKRLQSAVDQVKRGGFTVATVSGESGIGKTRLLAEARRLAQLDGVRCLTARPVELEKRISLNPILDAISDVDLEPHLTRIGEPWRTVVGTMLPSTSPSATRTPPPPIDESALSRRLLDAFALLLHSLAEEQPTIFFIDDLQWVDATTMAVIEFFGRRFPSVHFGVFTTVRTELAPTNDPLHSLGVHSGTRSPIVVRLGDLPTDAAEALVRYATEDQIESEAIPGLFGLAGRHPLFLIELAREVHAKGDETTGPLDEVPVPASVSELVEGRLRGLSSLALRTVQFLSTGRRGLSLATVASRLSCQPDEAAAAIHDLQRRSLLGKSGGVFCPASPMIAQAVYQSTPHALRIAFHSEWAEVLGRLDGEQNQAEVATHLDRAHDAGASKVAWGVAQRYRRQGAVHEAAYFFEMVTRNEEELVRQAHAFDHLGEALLSLRSLDRAVSALSEAAGLFSEAGLHHLARRSQLRRLSAQDYSAQVERPHLLRHLASLRAEAARDSDAEAEALALDLQLEMAFRAGDANSADLALNGLVGLLPDADTTTATVCHAGLAMRVLFGSADEGVESARVAASLSRTAGSHRGKALGRLLVALLLRGRLESEEGLSVLNEARAYASRTGDRRLRYIVESNRAIGLLDAGEVSRAEAGFDQAKEFVSGVSRGMDTFNWAYNRGELDLARNDFASARRWFEEAEAQPHAEAPAFIRALVDAAVGLSAFYCGDLREARRREARLPEELPPWCFDPTILVTFRAKLLDRHGRSDDADEMLREALRRASGRFELTWLKLALLLEQRLRKSGRTQEAAALAIEGLATAQGCGLKVRTGEFETRLERLSGIS